MVEAAPLPVFGTIAQSGLDRVAMDVAELLHELLVIADVEIVVALLPEVLGDSPTQAKGRLEWGTHDIFIFDQASGDALLQRLQGIGKRAALGLAY